jgi:hypothetical protein
MAGQPSPSGAPPRPPWWLAALVLGGFGAVLLAPGWFQARSASTSSTTETEFMDTSLPRQAAPNFEDELAPPSGRVPGLSGRLVVVTGSGERDGFFARLRLRVWDAESGLTTVSDLPRSAWQFAADPAGGFLAYRDGDGALWIQDLDAPDGTRVVDAGVCCFAWSPDGSRLSVVRTAPGDSVATVTRYPVDRGLLGEPTDLAAVPVGTQVVGWNLAGIWLWSPPGRVELLSSDGEAITDYSGTEVLPGDDDRAIVVGSEGTTLLGGLFAAAGSDWIPAMRVGMAWAHDTDPRLAIIGWYPVMPTSGWLEIWNAEGATLVDSIDLPAPTSVGWDWADRFVVMAAHPGGGQVLMYDTFDRSLDGLTFGDEVVQLVAVVPPLPRLDPHHPADGA